MKIGMAVLAYERHEYLRQCLNSLFRTNLYDYDVTFLINDDGSIDPRVREIINKPRNEKYKIIRSFTTKGPPFASSAINKAMRILLEIDDFDIVGWTDPDAIYHPEWLDKTMKTCLWAKRNYKGHYKLGPWSSWNASNWHYHRILENFNTPYGRCIVKRQMGMLNYFYLKEEFLNFGFFDECPLDEELMTRRFEIMGVRNFCTETSFIENIGVDSTLRNRGKDIPKAVNLFPGDWDSYVADEDYIDDVERDFTNYLQLNREIDHSDLNRVVGYFDKFIKPETASVVLDVGSRDLHIAIGLSVHYPNAKVFAFECNPVSIKICRNNMRNNITLIEKAVTDTDGTAVFHKIDTQKTVTPHRDGNIGASSLFVANREYPHETYFQRDIVVPCTTLKSWMAEYGITNIDLIWMDLQGAELQALRGLGEAIKGVKVIYTEVLYKPMYLGAPLFDKVHEYLVAHGFMLVERFNTSPWFGDVLYKNRNL